MGWFNKKKEESGSKVEAWEFRGTLYATEKGMLDATERYEYAEERKLITGAIDTILRHDSGFCTLLASEVRGPCYFDEINPKKRREIAEGLVAIAMRRPGLFKALAELKELEPPPK